MFNYTEQQIAVLKHIKNNDGMLLINAGAGCSKSTIAREAVRTLELEKVLYTAFNKAIVEEAKEKFEGMMVDCRTLSSLAYRFTHPRDIQELTYNDIAKGTYKVKKTIIEGLNKFFLSPYHDIHEFFEEYYDNSPSSDMIIEESLSIIDEMLDYKRPWTFNFMLKYFHILLKDGDISPDYNLVILDEINDTTAVALEIFRLLKAPKKLGLGEPDQAIYEFMDLVDGFEYFKDEPLLHLSHSFRCSKPIATAIEKFMVDNVNDEFEFSGTDTPVSDGKTLVVTRTNGAIIEEVQRRIVAGKGFTLLRKPAEIFACVLALSAARAGKRVFQRQYKYLEDVYRKWQRKGNKPPFFVYLKEQVEDQEISSGVNLINKLAANKISVFSLYSEVKDHKVDPDYTVATVFTSKGLEFETVRVDDSLNSSVKKILANGGASTPADVAELRCYYVACSRARVNLMGAQHLKL